MPLISIDVTDTVHEDVKAVETAAQGVRDVMNKIAEKTKTVPSRALDDASKALDSVVNFTKKHIISVS